MILNSLSLTQPLKIAIASGKGGTGKTFVATNLYTILQQQSLPALLIDCDAEEPNDHFFFKNSKIIEEEVYVKIPEIDSETCKFCGKCYEYCNYNAIFYIPTLQQIHVINELCHSCGACLMACEYHAITEHDVSIGKVRTLTLSDNYNLVEARVNVGVYSPVPVINNAIKKSENVPITLLDAPPGTSCPFIHTVNKADYVILVAEPTPFGLSDLKKTIEVLHILKKSFGIIINKANIGNNDVFNFIKKENYDLLLSIPFEKEVATLYSKGEIVSNVKQSWNEIFEKLLKKIVTKVCN